MFIRSWRLFSSGLRSVRVPGLQYFSDQRIYYLCVATDGDGGSFTFVHQVVLVIWPFFNTLGLFFVSIFSLRLVMAIKFSELIIKPQPTYCTTIFSSWSWSWSCCCWWRWWWWSWRRVGRTPPCRSTWTRPCSRSGSWFVSSLSFSAWWASSSSSSH